VSCYPVSVVPRARKGGSDSETSPRGIVVAMKVPTTCRRCFVISVRVPVARMRHQMSILSAVCHIAPSLGVKPEKVAPSTSRKGSWLSPEAC